MAVDTENTNETAAAESWDYEAFISYSHTDQRWAKWLHRAIETYRLPSRLRTRRGLGKRLGRLFLDRSELPSSANLATTIQAALHRSRCLVVVCSPRAAASRWVNEEIRLFRSLGRGDRIFCLIVDGEIGGSDAAVSPFPPALTEGADAATEPLAADVRPRQDRPADAKLKLIAGLLGVSFDELRQREAVRRQRRLAVVATVSVVLMLVMLGLTITAVAARREAERQTQTALRTTDFLRSLFAISNPETGRGAAVTAREMLDRGVAELSDPAGLREEPAVRAELLTTLAEVYNSLGLYKSADGLAQTAARIEGQNEQARARQARIIGEIAFLNSDYDRAERALREALQLAGPEPTFLRIQLLLAQGELDKATGRYAEAEAVLGEALRISRADGPSGRDNAVRALASLGATDFEAGNYDRAIVRLREVIAARTALSGASHPEVALALNTLGTVAIKRGERDAAARYFSDALAQQRRVLGVRHPAVAITEANLARALVEGGRFAESAKLAAGARATILLDNDGTLDSLANVYDTLGLAQRGLGRNADAEASFRAGLQIARLHEMPKEGEILVDLAELQCATKRTPAGLAGLDLATAAYRRTGAAEPWRAARLASVRGGCLLEQGDRAAAAPLIRASTAEIARRWGAGSLFDLESRRLEQLARR